MPSRRTFLKSAVASAAAASTLPAFSPRPSLASSPSTSPSPSGKRPLNLLFLMADDQRSDTLHSVSANPHISTPNLDRLASSGFAFTHCRTMGALGTGAVCVPSRAMLHTGRFLYRTPDNMGSHPLLGQTLQQHGYTSFAAGKWHNGPASFARSFNAGSHIFFGGMNNDQFHPRYHDFDPAGHYPQSAAKLTSQFSTDFYTDAAAEFLQSQAHADKPFFCYLAFTSPHDPRTPPPPFDKMYDPAKIPLPDNFFPQHPFDNGELRNRDENLAPFPRTPDDTRRQIANYWGMVSSQDAALGRLLDLLASTGLAENTLVVYTGDHGLAIGSHGLFGKQNVYEHSVGVPFLLSGPGIPHGTSDALCYGADIFPTLCSLLGLPAPSSVDGSSLAPVLSGSARSVRDSAYNAYVHHNPRQHCDAHMESLRDSRWKLILSRTSTDSHTQLFDLETDPHELHDLSKDPAASVEIPRLTSLMNDWHTRYGAPPTA